MNRLAFSILIVIALVVAIFLYQKYRVAPTIKFENLELTDLNGKPVSLGDYKGKKLFLNFFATWCGPCVGEFTTLNQAAQLLAADNFVFIGISDEPVALLNRFRDRINTDHIIILHSTKKLHDLRIFTVPTSYLLNDKGIGVYEKTGEQNWSDAEVLEQLKQKAN